MATLLRDGHWRVILGVRELELCAGQAALPGVLLRPMEWLEWAALRALSTKVLISDENVLLLMKHRRLRQPRPSPRSATLSTAHVAVIEPEDESGGVVYH